MGKCPMGKRSKSLPSAFRHGAYSGTTILPGEDPNDFDELHSRLAAEFAPAGPLEEDIVTSMARLVWRRQNLSTYKLAALAKNRSLKIRAKYGPRFDPNVNPLRGFEREDLRTADQMSAEEKAAEREVRTELGDAMALVEMGDGATIEGLFADLSVIDRLDSIRIFAK